MSIFEIGHADTSPLYWEAFRKAPPRHLFSEIIDRSRTELPDYFVPLARGVAVPSNLLFRRAGYRRGRIPSRWEFLGSDFVRDSVHGPLWSQRYGDLWSIQWGGIGMLPQALVYRFGSTPIVTRTGEEAMRLAEHCISNPSSGLCWVSIRGGACGEHLIEFAKQRNVSQALAGRDAHIEDQSNKAA